MARDCSSSHKHPKQISFACRLYRSACRRLAALRWGRPRRPAASSRGRWAVSPEVDVVPGRGHYSGQVSRDDLDGSAAAGGMRIMSSGPRLEYFDDDSEILADEDRSVDDCVGPTYWSMTDSLGDHGRRRSRQRVEARDRDRLSPLLVMGLSDRSLDGVVDLRRGHSSGRQQQQHQSASETVERQFTDTGLRANAACISRWRLYTDSPSDHIDARRQGSLATIAENDAESCGVKESSLDYHLPVSKTVQADPGVTNSYYLLQQINPSYDLAHTGNRSVYKAPRKLSVQLAVNDDDDDDDDAYEVTRAEETLADAGDNSSTTTLDDSISSNSSVTESAPAAPPPTSSTPIPSNRGSIAGLRRLRRARHGELVLLPEIRRISPLRFDELGIEKLRSELEAYSAQRNHLISPPHQPSSGKRCLDEVGSVCEEADVEEAKEKKNMQRCGCASPLASCPVSEDEVAYARFLGRKLKTECRERDRRGQPGVVEIVPSVTAA